MKKIGILILIAIICMGGCKTKGKVQKPEEGTSVVDSIAIVDSTAINVETPSVVDVPSAPKEEPMPEGPAFVNTTGEPIVAHINTIEVLEAMPEKAKADKELSAYQSELENQIKVMVEEYQKKVQQYQSEQDSLSDLMKQTRQNEILDIQNRIQMFQENAEKELANKQSALYAPIMERLQKAVGIVTRENGFTYLMDLSSGAIVYIGDDAIDATPLVKKKLGLK